MSAFVVAARELREKSLLLLVAAAFAPLPFIAAAFTSARGGRLGAMAVVGGFLAVFLAWGSAVLLGATTVGRPLSENRLSFFFAKPLSAASIWFGKAGGSLALSLAAFAIAAGPALIVGRRELDHVWLGSPVLLTIAVVGTIVLFFLSHTLSTMTRSRSMLLGLDFVSAILALAAIALILRPILFGGGRNLAAILLAAIALGILAILVVAPVRQLSVGRTDARRSHRALSATVWPSVVMVLVAAAGYATWVTSVSPADLALREVEQSPRGDTFFMSGRTAGRGDYQARFLVDSGTEEHRDAGWRWNAQYSADGSVCAWFQPDALIDTQFELQVARGSAVRATPIRVDRLPYFTLSSDGRRVAISRDGTIEVHAVDSGRVVAVASGFDRYAELVMVFVGPNVVRVYEYTDRGAKQVPLRIYEFDTAARRLTKTGERLITPRWWPLQISTDGRTMLVRTDGVVADARTGATLRTLPGRGERKTSTMMHGGRIATVVTEANKSTLLVYGADAQLLSGIPLGEARDLRIVRETTNGKLLLDRLEDSRGRRRDSSLLIVDLRRGVIERVVKGFLAPFSTLESPGVLHDDRFPIAGFNDDGKLALVDVRTGVKRPLKD